MWWVWFFSRSVWERRELMFGIWVDAIEECGFNRLCGDWWVGLIFRSLWPYNKINLVLKHWLSQNIEYHLFFGRRETIWYFCSRTSRMAMSALWDCYILALLSSSIDCLLTFSYINGENLFNIYIISCCFCSKFIFND
jgi:hypothetical protein